jgi:hypothetical protein
MQNGNKSAEEKKLKKLGDNRVFLAGENGERNYV